MTQEANLQAPVSTEESQPRQGAKTLSPEAPSASRGQFLFKVAAILTLVGVCVVMAYNLALSLVDYSPTRGLPGSSWAGARYYEMFLSNTKALRALNNSLMLRLLQLAAGLLLGAPLALVVSLPKKPGRVLTLASLFLIPVCLPYISCVQLVQALLPRDILMSGEGFFLTYTLCTVCQTAGFFAFCGGVFAYLKRRGIGNGTMQGVKVALLISLLSLLTPEMEAVFHLRHMMNQEYSETLDILAYRAGLQKMQISYSAAISCAKVLLQMVAAILPALLLCSTARRDTTRLPLPPAVSGKFTFTAAHIFWVAALGAAFLALFGLDNFANDPSRSAAAIQTVLSDETLLTSLIISVLVALTGGALAAAAAYGLALLLRDGKGMGLAAVLLGSALSCVCAQYLLVRGLGGVNTLWPVVLRQMVSPRVVALALVFCVILRMAPERRTRGLPMLFFGVGAACAWGDVFSPMIIMMRKTQYPLALMLRSLLMGGAYEEGVAVTEDMLLVQKALQPVAGLLVAAPALLLGSIGAAACIRALKNPR